MEHIIQYVFISFPEALIFLYFAFAIMGIDLKTTWKQGLLLSVLYSFITVSMYYIFSYNYSLRLVISCFLLWGLLKLFFPFSALQCVFITIVRIISQIIIESVAVFIFSQVTKKDIQQLNFFPDTIVTVWLYFITVILLTFYISNKKITLPNIINVYRRFNLTVLLWVWTAILLVISINSIVMFYALTYPDPNYTPVSIPLVFGLPLLSAILASYMVYRFAQNMATLTMKQTEEVYLEYMNELITHFRSQRHDFLNHMQVVYGFAKMGNLQGILRYLEDLNLEADETLSLLQIKHPPMAALLRAKAATGTVKQIQFQVKVQASLDKLSIRPFELVKVVGNIIDNAFDEEMKAPEHERYVEVTIEEGNSQYISIHVYNRNSYIKPEEMELIFRQGYTSKSDHHSGTGLAISKQIVRRYGGEITAWSEPRKGTRFTVTLPVNGKGYK